MGHFPNLLSDILLCFPTKAEAAPFNRTHQTRNNITVLITGIGKENTKKSLLAFLSNKTPSLVIMCGFTGGLDPKLNFGDIVYTAIHRHNTELSVLYNRLESIQAKSVNFFCSDEILMTSEEKSRVRASHNADAVEMESEAISQICREKDIPCLMLRVISDTADETLPSYMASIMRPDFSINYFKLFLFIMSPKNLMTLFFLCGRGRMAAKKLSEALLEIIQD